MAEILHPHTLAEATAMLLDRPDARALGGGTAIQILRREGLLDPPALVDLDGLPALRGIRNDDGFLRIGAMVSQREVELSEMVRAAAPLLAETYRHVANVRVRNTATVGGNLAHGDFRLDPPAALLVLDAAVLAAGPRGHRIIPLAEFFVDPMETALGPGELIVELRVPLAHPRRSAHFEKFSSLGANDWPCVSVAVLLEWDEGDRPTGARLGIAAMAPTPLLVRLEDVARLDEAGLAEAAAEAALAAVDPIPDIRGSVGYKRRVCAAIVRDAIGAAWNGAKEAARA
jgi:carbon-monoxide dehydrogenase medium subunit